jgi:hypothetical protein
MYTTQEEWQTCDSCGGDIPPETQWGRRGERRDGQCPRQQRNDRMCGAFAARTQYRET